MRRAFHSPPGRENARTQPEYATVKATLAQRTDLAILLARDDLVQSVWVPKRALEISSRIKVEKAVLRTEVSVGVELAFALKNRLV